MNRGSGGRPVCGGGRRSGGWAGSGGSASNVRAGRRHGRRNLLQVTPTRERFVLRMSRPRRDMAAPHKFSDRDSHEDPNMQQNDCRGYKDPNFELKRREHDVGVQARAGDARGRPPRVGC